MSGKASSITGQEALKRLIEGNKRYIAGHPIHPNQDEVRRTEVAAGQLPFAVVLTCSDSRVPPEIIFDQGIGDVFVIRTAGNVVDDVAIGSIEYGVEHLEAPLVLVMGHTKCGAVTAATQGGEPGGHIGSIIEKIATAVEKAQVLEGDLVENSIDANVSEVVTQLRNCEPILKHFWDEGKVKIGGAIYNLESGKVSFQK